MLVKVVGDEVKVGGKVGMDVGVAQWSWSRSSATSINWCRAVAIRTNEVPRSMVYPRCRQTKSFLAPHVAEGAYLSSHPLGD